MDLKQVIVDLEQYLHSNISICIYIAIGSAAHMVRDNILEDTYYQQYPKFLEEMHNSIENMRTIHILIDPMMESPPFITIDKSKGLEFISLNSNHFITKDKKHIVYSIKEYVTTKVYLNNLKCVDITDDLHTLNQLAIKLNILLIYNDFSGKNIKPLADYFDNTIQSNLDHIVYGIGNRGDHGCYIDLISPDNMFAFKLENNNIKVFNIYNAINNNLNLQQVIDSYDIKYIDIIYNSITYVLKSTIEYFNSYIFVVLRYIYQLKINKIHHDYYNELFNKDWITKEDSIQLQKLIELEDYNTCFAEIIKISANQLIKCIYLKNLTLEPYELMQLIVMNENEYNWGTVLKSILLDSY